MTPESDGRRALESHLISRALRDDEFRHLLNSDPRGAVAAEIERLGIPIRLPSGLKVKVLHEERDTMYLVLPPDLAAPEPRAEDLFLEALSKIQDK